MGKQSHPSGLEATQIVAKPDAGPSFTETSHRCEIEISHQNCGHVKFSYKNFGQDQTNNALYQNMRKIVIKINEVPVERNPKGSGPYCVIQMYQLYRII